MDEKQLKVLARRGLSLLRLSTDEWAELEETRLRGRRFSLIFPHGVARSGRPKTLALLAISGEEPDLRLGLIRSIQSTATLDSRVVFDLIQPIHPGTLKALLAGISATSLRSGAKKLALGTASFQPVSEKLGAQLIELITAAPTNAPVLQRILAEVGRPKHYENARALQEDAVNLALKVFGAANGAMSVALPGAQTAIGTIRLQEDAIIEHDARWIPGWRLASSDLTGKAVFTRHDEQLEVFTANKRPLEELFGVDLIYLNRARGALVMIQYKMMESERRKGHTIRTEEFEFEQSGEHEWTVPINAQFQDELNRMERFDKDLDPGGPYRLNPGAFFFKLVRRHAATNSAGIILSLGHLNQLITEGAASGPRGGLRISYKSLGGHYLRSDPLVELVRSGYIGTRGATTDHLEELIDAALTGGRAVVAAIQREMI
ncbi:MAG: hypothetical protein EKK46_09030 [Rhodocyclaceae bacterium]|nr:MAG: hypothetical protein EKK46_09030 [Rhodocyclaceae bacterium]